MFANIDPIAFSFGPIDVYWYSLSYVFGIILGWGYINILVKKFSLGITKLQVEEFITWLTLGIILGGRLGYVLFYNPAFYLSHPLEILKTYNGGMSFHGAILGSVICASIFSKLHRISFFRMSDLVCVVCPIGLTLGRIANFINGELYGKVTNVAWGVIFPKVDMNFRHPSQLYEAGLEGVTLFIILNILTFRYNSLKYLGMNSGVFLTLYAIFRVIIEFFREPDAHIGLLAHGLTLGQYLSIPMGIIGLFIYYRSRFICR